MQTFLPLLNFEDKVGGTPEGFLPFPDFGDSAAMLDEKRLGKQRVENLQIMIALLEWRGWIHHPAVRMWRGYEWALLKYQEAICDEWVHQCGHKDTCFAKTKAVYFKHRDGGSCDFPPWLGDARLHFSHQSNLLRKNPDYYRLRFPGVPDDVPYFWPS